MGREGDKLDKLGSAPPCPVRLACPTCPLNPGLPNPLPASASRDPLCAKNQALELEEKGTDWAKQSRKPTHDEIRTVTTPASLSLQDLDVPSPGRGTTQA